MNRRSADKNSKPARRTLTKKYYSIFNSVPVSVVMVDKEGRIIDINPYHIEKIGRKKVTKKDFLDTRIQQHPSIVSAGIADDYLRVLQGETINLTSIHFPVTTGGRGGYFNIRGVPLFNEGKVTGAVLIHEDVTKLEIVGRELEKEKEKYRLLVENQADLIVKLDADGRLEFVSPSLCETFGRPSEEFIGKKFTAFLNNDTRKNIVKASDEIQRFPHKSYVEQKAKTVRGLRWFSWNGTAIMDNSGTITGTMGIGRDITEQKLADKKIREEEETRRALLNMSPESAFLLDTNGRFLEMNDITAQRLGYPKSELIGKCAYDLISPKLAASRKQKIETAVKEKKAVIFVDERDGFILSNHANPIIDTDGIVRRVAVFTTDITKQKKFEQQQKEYNLILEKKVEERTTSLEELNTALTVLIKKMKEEKSESEEKIFYNFELLISPLLNKIKMNIQDKTAQSLLDLLESQLQTLLSSFSKKLTDPMKNLTATEIQIASLIKQGFRNKEIAQMMSNSVNTVTNHRSHIRKKLGLVNKKVNLQTYLSNL